jgi:hypothetical protein
VSRAYFDAQLSWYGPKPSWPVPGRRISYSRWGSILLRTRHPACYLAAPGRMGPHRLETTQRSYSIQLSSCCAGSVSWVHHPGYSAWEVQAHRTLAASPDSADLVRAARVQALITSTTSIVTEAAATMGQIDRDLFQRLGPRLEATNNELFDGDAKR